MISKSNFRVRLRKITKNDLKTLRDWRNSKDVYEFNTQFTLLNMKDQLKWFNQINAKNSDRVMFIALDKSSHPIGVCGLIHINKINRHAAIAIILGEKNIRGKRFGTEMLHLLIEYGFKEMKLHRIEAEVFEYNKISINLFEKFSFLHEVTLRQSLWRNGRWWDIYLFSLLKSDYKKSRISSV